MLFSSSTHEMKMLISRTFASSQQKSRGGLNWLDHRVKLAYAVNSLLRFINKGFYLKSCLIPTGLKSMKHITLLINPHSLHYPLILLCFLKFSQGGGKMAGILLSMARNLSLSLLMDLGLITFLFPTTA